ncbi:MAG: tetratricopeptide repeat protein, partial [Clostridia bacterium]|nr:tetratricopeptide repeat protein [Deltaproteobacteria bacterium]
MRRFVIPLLAVSFVACGHTVTEQDESQAKLQYDMGVTSLRSGDPRAALRDLLAAEERDPDLAPVHNALGLVYHSLGHGDDALAHYKKALRLVPEFSEAYNNMGTLLTDMGRYDEAIEAHEKAMSDILYGTPWLAEGNMAWAMYKKGDVVQSRKHLRNALATNPKFCRGYEWLARIDIEQGAPNDTVQSCQRFERYCAADPEIAEQISTELLREMRYYLAMGYLKTGNAEG